MDEGAPVPLPAVQSRLPTLLIWLRSSVCLILAALGVGVIWTLSGRLLGELSQLSAEWADARDREPVGYLGISSEQPEFKPKACVREENGRLLLWAGSGVKGQAGWFDVTGTDLPVIQFAHAFGRDKIKTIDYPIYQSQDGEIARKIYPERPVFGVVIDGVARAYPLTVLEKVEVVNDTVRDRAVVVAYCPLIKKATIYERSLGDEEISLGTSGYTYKDTHILYDRRTDSLWLPHPEGLKSISGHFAGKVLPCRTESLERTNWGDWQRRHPDTQVIVGGDRTRGIPLPGQDEVATRAL